MTVRAVLFEDLNKESPLYGAMAMGTQGLEISKIRTADGRDWDWTTAMTAEGIVASAIVAGILSDKTGRNYWDLDKGIVHMDAESFTLSGRTIEDITKDAIKEVRTISINLSNEYQVIQANPDGTIDNFPEVNTKVSVYFGIQNISARATYTVNAGNGITGSWDSDKYTYTVTGMSVDEGYVDIKAEYNSTGEKYTATRRFTVTKIRQGESGCYYNLVSQTDAVIWSTDKGSYEPLNPTMTAYKQIGEDRREEYTGDWIVEATKDGTTWTQMQQQKSASMIRIATEYIQLENGPQMLRATLYRKESEEILAQKTVQLLVPMKTQQDVFNALTNNGTVQTIILRDGKIYINAEYMALGTLADETGRNWWNLETGDIQMSGRFQQYAFNGVKSLDIFDNKINLYAWDDDGNYVGSLRSFLTVDKEHKGIELMSDADDQVRLSVKRRDTETEEGQSVFIGENGYTGLFTVDGKGNAEEWLSRKHGGPIWIRNMPNGDFLAGGVRIGVESGLITSIPENSVANGTFEVISGLSWANGGITSVDWVKVNVSNGAIKSWSTRTQNF